MYEFDDIKPYLGRRIVLSTDITVYYVKLRRKHSALDTNRKNRLHRNYVVLFSTPTVYPTRGTTSTGPK